LPAQGHEGGDPVILFNILAGPGPPAAAITTGNHVLGYVKFLLQRSLFLLHSFCRLITLLIPRRKLPQIA